MDKDQVAKWTVYRDSIHSRLTSPVPTKHVARPDQFKEFLKRELRMVQAKIDSAKMEIK